MHILKFHDGRDADGRENLLDRVLSCVEAMKSVSHFKRIVNAAVKTEGSHCLQVVF